MSRLSLQSTNDKNDEQSSASVHSKGGWLRLIACGTGLAVMWQFVLPAISRQPAVAERIERLEEQGIDPSANFYTELDAMPAAEQRIQRARAGDDDPLW